MSNLLIPGQVADSIRRDHGRGLSEAQRMLEFKARLQTIDSRFTDVFLALEDAQDYGIRKGFWYLERRDDEGIVSFIESSDGDGNYREPDERTLDVLRYSDTWNRDVWGQITQARDERERRKAKEKDETKREFREKLDERLKHEHDATISVPRKP